jgi:signal transduction histidine kinase
MGPSKQQHRLIAEVSHQVNSPLAAIRNALYLANQLTRDPEIHRYLAIADQEVAAIASRIRELREGIEKGFGPDFSANAPPMVQSMRKAA